MNVPPSPPETALTFGPSPAHGPQLYRPAASSFSGVHDSASIAGPTLRRQPSIFYNSPGHRTESRERTPSVSSKLLVVVVPPVSIVQEHGNLGHTLSLGPSHRLSQGIIMPLFPNMYGQLTAIAKEFNFPSITGLCLYYCYHDSGITMTPRLSEEIWPTIWGLSDVTSREKRPPIAGKLEFDIDTGKARWYGAWLSSRQRESIDYPFYHPAATAPGQHYRGDGRFTFPQTVVTDDLSEPIQQHSAPVTRHVPRKLSLVERFDVASAHGTEVSTIGHQVHDSHNTTGAPISSHILSPIKQLEEPKSARAELDNKVNTWRATAIASPVPIQSSVEPASILEPPSSAVSLRLEDYAWSISSFGPNDNESIATDFFAPSVHICDRINGSVASTASYRTSPGPSDRSAWMPLSDDSRLPSPDVGHRMFEDAPPTPITATSWGAPTHYSTSFITHEYEPSLDIGYRACFSRPSTPGTATSWGPQSDGEWLTPESPISSFSVHLCDRGEFSRPITPQTATSWGPPSYPPSPPSSYRLPTPDIAHRGFEDAAQMVLQSWPGRPWRHAWPYNRKTEGAPKQISSRWVPIISKVVKHRERRTRTASVFPSQDWSGYPHFNLYPPVQIHISSDTTLEPRPTQGYPAFDLYPAVPVYSKQTLRTTSAIVQRDTYGYPYNLDRIYEANQLGTLTNMEKKSESNCRTYYPFIQLYPAVYPFNLDLIYAHQPKVILQKSDQPQYHNLPRSQYPFFEIYASVYPHNLDRIYPHVLPLTEASNRPLGKVMAAQRIWQYPVFDLYPAVYPFNLQRIYPQTQFTARSSEQSAQKHIVTQSNRQYPFFNLYPTVYPYNLEEIYPTIAPRNKYNLTTKVTSHPVEMGFTNAYPFIQIYRPVYPWNLDAIYPDLDSGVGRVNTKVQLGSGISPLAGYPFFEIYPGVYPFFNLYPPFAADLKDRPHVALRPLVVISQSSYPYFQLYPPIYPCLDLYPAIAVSTLEGSLPKSSVSTVRNPLGSAYPYFEFYPAVYPYFNLWPTLPLPVERPLASSPSPPIGPLSSKLMQPTSSSVFLLQIKDATHEEEEVRRRSGSLTHAELHAMVMMESRGGPMELDDVLQSFPSVPVLPASLSRSSSLSFSSQKGYPRDLKTRGASTQVQGARRDRLSRSISVSDRSGNPSSTLAQRRSMWENNVLPSSSRPVTMKPQGRRRDSIVLQRVRTFTPTSVSTAPSESLM